MTLPRVSSTETVNGVLARLGHGRSWWALVVDPDGSMGALVSTDVERLLEVAQG